MKQVLIGIFAHPDDESFGPSATLLKMVEEGSDIHLIIVTNGENGVNIDGHEDLGVVRLAEWHMATSLIGAASASALGFSDSGISHGQYPEIGSTIRSRVDEIMASYSEPIELSLMTFDQNGLTGHLDHIAVSYLTTHLFHTLKDETLDNTTLSELWYYCLSTDQAPTTGWKTYYTPIGRDDNFINRRIDVRAWLPEKYAVMDCHISQRSDAETHKKMGDDLLAIDHFHVVS